MSRGFGKYRRGASHSNFHFDTLFKENANKPSAARSAASVGKWGITSFTSIRTLNGRPDNDSSSTSAADATPKPKKFFKSRNPDSQEVNTTPTYQSTASYGSNTRKSRANHDGDKHTKGNSSPKKFFSSKNAHEKVTVPPNTSSKRRNSDRSDTSESPRAPIVLRICRGKSQLLNDTDESESTVTPSSTPSTSATTSPRALRESSNSQTDNKPPTRRITRSARRSMQMDPSSSPVTADTPSEFSLFTNPKEETLENDLSPQYIPAEKYELERKAMYDSLLRPDSPKAEEKPVLPEPEENHANEAKDDVDSSLDKSVEDAMAELHGVDANTAEKTVQEENHSNHASLGEQEMDIKEEDLSGKSPEPPPEPTPVKVEEPPTDVIKEEIKLPEPTEESIEETPETIENIAKEIELTKSAKKEPESPPKKTKNVPVVRELRSRNRNKEKVVEKPVEPVVNAVKKPFLRETRSRKEASATNKVVNNDKRPLEEVEPEVVKEVEAPVPVVKEENTQIAKKFKGKEIEEEWCTDSDSNSTMPEMEVKQIVPSPDENINEIEKHKHEILDKILEKPPEPPPVKLLISKKKGSIFKSRALVDDDSKKRRARYVHKWIDDKDGKPGGETPARTNPETTELDFDEYIGEPLTRLSKVEDEPGPTSVHCPKTDKPYYMVVRNVKKAHQIQEIGEFQEFNDDVEYILDALQDNNPISTRCLSAITLATKCMAAPFRMHVRAHGIVAKFFKALHDATKDQSLGLCTATVMFVLSQDRLNMDLDRDCLELMLNLLESDVSYQQALDVCGLSTGQLEKNKQKVRELCADIQSQGHAMHLNLENITTGQLAMETLLSLTSKRAGEWFKEELRELGGLEHIMKTIHECCRQVSDYVVSWTDLLLDKIKKVDRCLRVLENVTQNNEENQTYILKYNSGMMIDTLVSLYKLCDREIPLYPVTDITDKVSTGAIIREALLVTLKVLINLTHHYRQQSLGSQLIGSKSGIIEISLHLLLQVPNYIPEQKKFELGVLVLMLLINLIQDQEANKKLLMDAKAPSKLESIYSREESAVEALIIQFYEWEGCAKIAENKTNAILDGEKDVEDVPTSQNKSNEEFIEETVAKLLQKAGTHMEFTFLASYIVMLIGFLIMDNSAYQDSIRQFLRGSNFNDMVELLKKFFNFMNLTASTEASSVCAVKATQKVIKFLEECDKSDDVAKPEQEEPAELVEKPFL
ncbi:protein wings apart-like isoform X2 [Sitophilus oryzae]|uniref:Protein wings apart-like isoform X2 n=1 Tax=Sitophilus oryzae TaxID=7048 RepID=A0A6J2YC22_SITOR|nr:protein wings apart-like isoform X2 [Sitophilus oryzae]